ncbi:MAG: type II toxin-antitoxin system RelE/ParE family toxin [Sedimentisphaerales bacterium]|jgi:plasmid stabilization system protein ParE
MAELNWTLEAEKWLKDIHDYIALDNASAAQRVIKGIYDKAQVLKKYPKIGHTFSSDYKEDIRILLYGHYRIVYLIKPDKNIDILGVFHGALDIDKYLF